MLFLYAYQTLKPVLFNGTKRMGFLGFKPSKKIQVK